MIKGTEQYQDNVVYDIFARVILKRLGRKMSNHELHTLIDNEFDLDYLNRFIRLSEWEYKDDEEYDYIELEPRYIHYVLLLHSKLYAEMYRVHTENKLKEGGLMNDRILCSDKDKR